MLNIFIHREKDDAWQMLTGDERDTYTLLARVNVLILKELKRVQDIYCSYPIVDDDDIPDYIQKQLQLPSSDTVATELMLKHRWTWLLEEMIWTFRIISSGEKNLYADRLANGLRLYGKYFLHLWT